MDVIVGPILLTAFTPVKFEIIVDHNPSPAISPHSLMSDTSVILPSKINPHMMK